MENDHLRPKGLKEKAVSMADEPSDESSDASSTDIAGYVTLHTDKTAYSKLIISFFIHVVALLCLSVAAVFMNSSGAAGVPSAMPSSSSPAEEAVIYQRQIVDNTLRVGNKHIGEPSAEVDEAWDAITQYKNLALARSILDDEHSVEINDGSGRVLANLDVFYNLHCLNFVRKYIFRAEYPLKFPDNGNQVQRNYVTHCIDSIRQSLVCRADTSLHTYTWEDFQLVPYPDFKVEHECRNWGTIVDWAKSHAAPALAGSTLMHPTYGPSFPDM